MADQMVTIAGVQVHAAQKGTYVHAMPMMPPHLKDESDSEHETEQMRKFMSHPYPDDQEPYDSDYETEEEKLERRKPAPTKKKKEKKEKKTKQQKEAERVKALVTSSLTPDVESNMNQMLKNWYSYIEEQGIPFSKSDEFIDKCIAEFSVRFKQYKEKL